MFTIIKKWFDGVLKSYEKKPVNYLSGKKKSATIRVGDLEYKTKKELETIGRKIGIESVSYTHLTLPTIYSV